MARYVALATGSWDTVGTWGLVDATSLADGENAAHTVTTAYSGSRTAAFTPGAIVVAGICVKLNRRVGTTGTFDIHLALNSTHAEIAGTLVTINMSDFPAATVAADNNGGWIYLEFATPITLAAATAYELECRTSTGNMLVLWRFNATAGNISRLLVTTANPANLTTAGDTFDVCKRYTGAAASTAVTVTMNHAAATDYGAGTDAVAALTISGATLAFAFAASTNYYLKLSGDLICYIGSEFDIGTVANPIPSTSTAVLEFDPAADGGMGLILRNGSTFTSQGASMTKVWDLLAADAAISATSLTSANSTGWKNGDQIAIASTTKTTSDCEMKALTADAVGTALTITALTVAHDGGNGGPGGVSDAAELANLTRNVKIRSATSTIMSHVLIKATAIINCDYTEFYYLGENAIGKKGIEIETTTGSCSLDYCSFHDFEDGGILTVSTIDNISLTYNVLYNMNSTAAINGSGCIHITVSPSSASITLDNNVIILASGTTFGGIYLAEAQIVCTNNRIAGMVGTTNNGGIVSADITTGTVSAANMSGNVIHSCSCHGFFSIQPQRTLIFSGGSIWRCLDALGISAAHPETYEFSPTTIFGCTSPQVNFGSLVRYGIFIMKNVTIDSEASYLAAIGISTNGGLINKVILENCSIGVNGTHSTADIQPSPLISVSHEEWLLFNCRLGSATEVAGVFADGQCVRSQRHDQSATTHKSWYRTGTVISEQTNVRTTSGYAWKLTPSLTTAKLRLPGPSEYDGFRVACPANEARIISIWILRNAAYNGAQPRIVIKGGIIQGIASDVVATATKTSKTITGATNATPIVIAATAHGFLTGERVLVEGVVGNTAANGMWTITEGVDANHFSLDGSVGDGAWSSGGTANVYEKLTCATVTPTEDSVVEYYADCDGTAGSIYVDDTQVL